MGNQDKCCSGAIKKLFINIDGQIGPGLLSSKAKNISNKSKITLTVAVAMNFLTKAGIKKFISKVLNKNRQKKRGYILTYPLIRSLFLGNYFFSGVKPSISGSLPSKR